MRFRASLQVRATKPGWELGSKTPLLLNLKKKASHDIAASASTMADPKAWSAVEGAGDEALMDDEELLTEEDKRPVVSSSECHGPMRRRTRGQWSHPVSATVR
jgi:hypothetical protein